jgi:hypothetical protein
VKVGFGEGEFWTWDFPISSHEDAHLHNEDDHLYSEDAHHQHNEG